MSRKWLACCLLTAGSLACLLTSLSAGRAQNERQGRIVFLSNKNLYPNLYTMNADGKAVTRVTKNNRIEIEPSFSPDHKRIAFIVLDDDKWTIHVIRVD